MKTNFKKLFVSILACISVVPSANFKVAAVDYVDINSTQDWLNIAEEIHQNALYTQEKYFRLNNDIVLEGDLNSIVWDYLYGTLDGNGHKIAVSTQRGHICESHAIKNLMPGGTVKYVNFASLSPQIWKNQGLITNCTLTTGNNALAFRSGVYFVRNNKAGGVISNCEFSTRIIAYKNSGTISNCSLRLDDIQIITFRDQSGEPDAYVGTDEVWNCKDKQDDEFTVTNNGGSISNCRCVHQIPSKSTT